LVLAGDAIQVSLQELFPFTFKFQEHDAVAELRMAGDHASVDHKGVTVEPKRDPNAGADRERHEQLDVATAATEVCGFQAHRNVGAFLAEFDLDLEGVTRMEAAIVFDGSGSSGLGVGGIRVGEIHGWLRDCVHTGPWHVDRR